MRIGQGKCTGQELWLKMGGGLMHGVWSIYVRLCTLLDVIMHPSIPVDVSVCIIHCVNIFTKFYPYYRVYSNRNIQFIQENTLLCM